MQSGLMKRTLAASHRELDAKLELLQQLGYEDRYFLEDDASIHDPSEKSPFAHSNTDRWIQTEYNWALHEAAESAASFADLFDVEEDEEACLPYVYDPTLFASPQASPTVPRSRSQSVPHHPRSDVDKPLPIVPSAKLRTRPSLPSAPPSSPAAKSYLSSPPSSPPSSPRSLRADSRSPPPSPRLIKARTFPRTASSSSLSSSPRPVAQRHATYPSISSTLSLLEERETEAEKRSAVYLTDAEQDSASRAVPMAMGRGRSSSATVPPRSGELSGPYPIGSSPKRRQRPALPALSTSASSPQLRQLAELAAMPSPTFSNAGSLLPSPMSDMTVTPDTEVVTPGEAITYSPYEAPPEDAVAEPTLASRWSLDSVASRPRITQMALDDAASSLPASKTKKRDRLLSLISGRGRSGSVTKPLPPPNTPRGSSDVLDIRRVDSRDAPSSSRRPSFTMPPKISMTPSLASSNSSNASSASTLATPIEPMHPSPLPDWSGAFEHSCMQEEIEEEAPVFAENPFYHPESPLMPAHSPPLSPSSPPPHHLLQQALQDPPNPDSDPLTLQIPDRPMSPGSPPPQPTLPLPSPGTPSPSFLVPSPRPQSFFASLTGRQRRRRKKLVISGAPLELGSTQPRASASALSSPNGTPGHGHGHGHGGEEMHHRQQEQQRRVHNVVKWCESFGPVRKIETKEDGSLHVYWKDWEVADMVCRVQAQVVIKDVGRVNLAWYYIS